MPRQPEYSDGSKITDKNLGIVLLTNFCSQVADICEGIEDHVVDAEDITDLIVDAVYYREPLSVVNLVYTELQKLIYTRRESHESFRRFESRFYAQLAKFTALGLDVALSDAISTLYMLASANVDRAQRFRIIGYSFSQQQF